MRTPSDGASSWGLNLRHQVVDMNNLPLATLFGIVGAIAGAVLGAWFNSIFTIKRERWNLQRELYSRLLESLGEVKDALDDMLDLHHNEPIDGDKTVQEAWDNRTEMHSQRASAAEEKLRLATWIATFMLPKEVSEALQELRSEWAKAHQNEAYSYYLEDKIAAATKAYNVLVEAAKRDLGF